MLTGYPLDGVVSEPVSDSRQRAQRSGMRPVALLEVDPDLAKHLQGGELEAARSRLCARQLELQEGPAGLPALDPAQGDLGLLIISGALIRRASIGRVAFAELIGPGDVLRQPAGTSAATWRALQPTRVALLDRSVAAAAARWPQISAEILDRSVARACRLAMQVAICHMRRVDERLLLLLWMVADRWGRVRTDGVVVPLALTHETLATLVGSHRPTVSAALKKLELQGAVEREGQRLSILKGERPEELDRMYASVM